MPVIVDSDVLMAGNAVEKELSLHPNSRFKTTAEYIHTRCLGIMGHD